MQNGFDDSGIRMNTWIAKKDKWTLAELEERSAEKMRKATDLFHQQYQTLMSTFETASVHMTAELRKMEVSLAQLPRTMDQTGAELNQLAAVLDKAARQESAEK